MCIGYFHHFFYLVFIILIIKCNAYTIKYNYVYNTTTTTTTNYYTQNTDNNASNLGRLHFEKVAGKSVEVLHR
jgi:hypothetical protein